MRVVLQRIVLGVGVLCGLAPAIAIAADEAATPPAAAERFTEATRLMQRGRYVEASEAYRSVADWSDGGAFPQRAQALFLAASMLESARDYEKALALYAEAAGRFAERAGAEGRAGHGPTLQPGYAPWHFLNFLPEPHQHGSLRPIASFSSTIRCWTIAGSTASSASTP